MFDFHEKRRVRSVLYSKTLISLLFVFSLLISWSAYKRFEVEREMRQRSTEREVELAELKSRAAALEAQVNHLTNERGIEEELRSRFDVAKEGEQVVVIVEDEQDISAGGSVEENAPQQNKHKKNFLEMIMFWKKTDPSS